MTVAQLERELGSADEFVHWLSYYRITAEDEKKAAADARRKGKGRKGRG